MSLPKTPPEPSKPLDKPLTTVGGVVKEGPAPPMDYAASPDAFSSPVVAFRQKSDSEIVREVIEGIFQDLARGIRAEEVLRNHNGDPSDGQAAPAQTDTVGGENPLDISPPNVTTSSNRSLGALGIDLVGAIAAAELAEAILVLKAAYWLDRQPSPAMIYQDSRPSFYRSILSYSHEYCSGQFGSALPATTDSMRSRNTTIISDFSISRLLPTFIRYHQFSKIHGWKLLTLLSLSRTFRSAASDLPKFQWSLLVDLVASNNGSFELILKTTRPRYGFLLVFMFRELRIMESIANNPSAAWVAASAWTYASASATCLSEVEDLDDPMAIRYLNHPHRWFLTIDRKSIKPVIAAYIPIDKSVLHSGDFSDGNDPRYIGGDCETRGELGMDRRKVCELCERKMIDECYCTFNNWFPEPLIELIQTEGKGLGVRSLQKIKQGQLLGEYAGVIRIDAGKGDVYVLNGPLANDDKDFYLTTSRHKGNFTRFINHSCSANCVLTTTTFRGKKLSIVMAVKDIELFDEITADYGEDYFVKRGMRCKCGSKECKIG